ncbi:hypothetical protein [Bdellovibrio reynosensis]|uniref:Outer membrane protein beta-barrel domain-containing protein n=1 Tax=Bdellovibrio reynosensis TaxID=2835041 RepID=A0ABY4CDC1_9BACT|nr:hypothetical protein [Bdellovibrio reynosensis]UOF00175.1 hypothetical protein MNR06_10725 [Bdellovibrio reynosensis]
MRVLVLIVLLMIGVQAQAYLTSDWDVSMGMTSLKYKYSNLVDDSLESSSTIEVNYSVNNPSLNTAMTLSFMEAAGGGGQQLPFTRIAVGARYYMFGVNGVRVVMDSTSEAKVWRPTPFIAINAGLSNLAVEGFNASLLDLSVRGGVEVPLYSDLLIIGQVALGSSLTSAASEDEAVTYNSMTLFAGIRFVGFE